PSDAEFILRNTKHCHGFYGASSMERLPTELAMTDQTKKFKAIAFGRAAYSGARTMVAQSLGSLILWLIILAIAIVIAVYLLRWMYQRSTKETAFVRTGFGGEKVVVSGGAFVIPVLHDVTPVSMSVTRIEVARRETQALITKNRMRVDIIAEFFVKVDSSREAVSFAAQTLGRRTLQANGTRDLLEGRF